MAAQWSDTYAPERTCPRCGRTGRDWGFRYRRLCKKCHAEWRRKKAEERRKYKSSYSDNVTLSDGTVVTEGVHKRLRRRAGQSVLGGVDFIDVVYGSLVICACIACLGFFVADTAGRALRIPIIVGTLLLIALYVGAVSHGLARTLEAKTIKLARIRQRSIEEQQRFYNSPEWKNVRAQVVSERPRICESCGRRIRSARDLTVDHIMPRSKFPDLALEKSNLQVLCRRCNSAKGARITEGGGAQA